MAKRVLVSILLLAILGSTTASQESIVPKVIKVEKIVIPKDPLISGLLSLQYPGLGQVYCGRYLRGALFFAGEISCIIGAAVILRAGEEFTYRVQDTSGNWHELTGYEEGKGWDELTSGERLGVVGLIIGAVGLHIWNVVDAYNLAHQHNREIIGANIGNEIDLGLGIYDKKPSIVLTMRF